jgi:BRCT domain type II-containing protein
VHVKRLDRTSLVAGVVIVITGVILLLDRLDAIDLQLGYGGPLLVAALGAILLTAGLEGPRDRD